MAPRTRPVAFLAVVILQGHRAAAFVFPSAAGIHNPFRIPSGRAASPGTRPLSHPAEPAGASAEGAGGNGTEETVVRAPLKYIGPYPVMSLRFPALATGAQRSKGKAGISLDFVLDTAANTNTINADVARELGLSVVGAALPGMGSAGAIAGGATYMLGDAQLEPPGEPPFDFMQNLTASALPIASPASAGLLSLAFLYSFEGGVEFDWGTRPREEGAAWSPPSIRFFAKEDEALQEALAGLARVRIDPVNVTLLPSVVTRVNGVDMPALLDTGSPITVLNSQAARQAGVETVVLPAEPGAASNPLTAMADRFKYAQASAQSAARGDVLVIGGTDGQPTRLLRSRSPARVSLVGEDGEVPMAEQSVFVGDIPGLAALDGLGVGSPPAVVLGMDVLRRRPRMLIRAGANEVYF